MNLQDCVSFARQNSLCFVSTTDGDQPRVRTMRLDWADESGFYFCVLRPKEACKQLHGNPKVEVCFFNHAADAGEWRQMRLTGTVEFVSDAAAGLRAYQARAGLEPMLRETMGVDLQSMIEVFRLAHGEAHFWTIADILKEHELERVKF
jgi:pyridoxamine 5'-phosphate oxidase